MSIAHAGKILFLIRSLNVGGAETQLLVLARALQRSGWAVVVATLYDGGTLRPEFHGAGVRVVSLGKRGRWDVIPIVLRLVSLLVRERPDIAHGVLNIPNILLGLVRPLFPRLRVVWGVAASDMDLACYDWVTRFEIALAARLSRLAHLVICNSHAGRDHHVSRGYPRERVVVICNGVDVERFRPDGAVRERMRREWRLGPQDRLVGLIGRLDPVKDHPNFLRAAARVAAERPQTNFLCLGDGAPHYARELRALAAQLGIAERVIWMPARADIECVYNALDVLVCASVSEGLPNVLLEAMATGIPCVATDVGDAARVIRRFGWLCRPSDSAALARAMLQSLEVYPQPAALREHILRHYALAKYVLSSAERFSRLIPLASSGARTFLTPGPLK